MPGVLDSLRSKAQLILSGIPTGLGSSYTGARQSGEFEDLAHVLKCPFSPEARETELRVSGVVGRCRGFSLEDLADTFSPSPD
jgi:hypothetical protein